MMGNIQDRKENNRKREVFENKIGSLLKGICDQMEDIKDLYTDIDYNKLIQYLKKDDIQRQFLKLNRQLKIISIRYYLITILDIPCLKMSTISDNGNKYVLGFYPCSKCDGIQVKSKL
jgi:hypothetical protein